MNPWLEGALRESREWGFLGPGDIEPHVEHSLGFARAWESVRTGPPDVLVDLGSGGGIPGLVLADLWRTTTRLVDSMVRRTQFLKRVAREAGAPPGIFVTCARVEDLARTPPWEYGANLVTARSFAPPAVVAECAARLLAPGGLLIVSEPPVTDHDPARWPADGLRALGLEPIGRPTEPFAFQVLERTGEVDARYPRQSGVPRKRPLF